VLPRLPLIWSAKYYQGIVEESIKADFPFVTKHLGYCGRIHSLTYAVTAGNHVASSRCPLGHTAIDLSADCFKVRSE
jgi:hypothetical protein